MTVLEQLATFVATADPSHLPQLDRDIQRRHLADTVVARIAGAASHDGRTLYFCSDCPGGQGGFDLWQIRREPKAKK